MTAEQTPRPTQKFIATEAFAQKGRLGEQQVWEIICQAFAHRHCIAYWRYPIFSQTGAFRKEPDILIADAQLGLIIIEVKSLKLENIVKITGHVKRGTDLKIFIRIKLIKKNLQIKIC